MSVSHRQESKKLILDRFEVDSKSEAFPSHHSGGLHQMETSMFLELEILAVPSLPRVERLLR